MCLNVTMNGPDSVDGTFFCSVFAPTLHATGHWHDTERCNTRLTWSDLDALLTLSICSESSM